MARLFQEKIKFYLETRTEMQEELVSKENDKYVDKSNETFPI